MMRHTFYFNVKAFHNKGKVNFKIYDVINGEGNNYNTHTVQYRSFKGNEKLKFGQMTEYNKRNIFLQISCRK